MMAKQRYNIGPGAMADAGTEGGPGFSLSKREWLAIQVYVTNALSLPTNQQEFKNSLGPGAPDDLSDFDKLIACYSDINIHCTAWQNDTFPTSVSLASQVYAYGINKVPIYYPAINKETAILVDDPDNENAKKALKAILDNLEKTAKGYANSAAEVASAIRKFADQTSADQTTLVGPKGDAGLVKYYNDEYGSKSAEVRSLTEEIKAQGVVLATAQEEYEHDVIVASTTPTYGWIFPVGTIAAAVVAGVYGDKAVKALDRAKAAQKKIDELNEQRAADANLINAIHLAEQGMGQISRELAGALPVIQKIEGIWGGIADDLASIAKLIDTDIRQVPPIIMNLGVDEAIKAWHNVALAANAYRLNAYIQETGKPSETSTGDRVLRLVASQ
ncbi:alpha-xenorhabdolysin family binary toxin subunit A [Salinivibrio socompensis]|uniref:alpha-xenorhabdolysin family binary toxin subunit A n=1 Tax=Salinivibrio socompensis TaxID=1510206 RepID=UPI000472D22E|nr:alpha-xenorhabdolysin family binary toxin subunit A [Salinivibrio socompensis]